ncbi:hypothetical protein BJX68DRAFT_248777 [Aspergillus pseudodeflectus]|uniref:Secreted protein n=1 Tax=Aspergillus pseudodeflectus TaxID=176178 RepID=A0ABR4JF65_9EURO
MRPHVVFCHVLTASCRVFYCRVFPEMATIICSHNASCLPLPLPSRSPSPSTKILLR